MGKISKQEVELLKGLLNQSESNLIAAARVFDSSVETVEDALAVREKLRRIVEDS